MGVNSWLDFAPAPRFPETPERKERRQIVVVIGRISSRGYLLHIKTYPNGVEDEVTQRCKTIVEVIRGIVFQMSQAPRRGRWVDKRSIPVITTRLSSIPSRGLGPEPYLSDPLSAIVGVNKVVGVNKHSHRQCCAPGSW